MLSENIISLRSCSCCRIIAYCIHTDNYKGPSASLWTNILEWLWLNWWMSWKYKLLAWRGFQSWVSISHSCYVFHSRQEIYSLKRRFLFQVTTGFEEKKEERKEKKKKNKNPTTFRAFFAHCKETQTGYEHHFKNSLPVTIRNHNFL